MTKKYYSNHVHTDRSNFRLKDAINKVDAVIDYAVELGLQGVTISDHETLAAHIEAIQYVKKGKENGKIPKDFKLGLGNEIYLLDRDEVALARENNEPTRYYHFLLTAKDKKGYMGLKELSSQAWKNSFWHRGMERVPTYKDELEEVMKKYKGHIIATSACLGSEFAQTVLHYVRNGDMVSKRKIHELVTWYLELFGDDFYIELQPSEQPDQLDYNKMAINIAKGYGIKTVVATDAHYLNKDQAFIHETYLKSDEGEREVASFYSTTYLMSVDELWDFFKPHISREYFESMLDNTLEISNKIQEYDLKLDTIVPKVDIPEFKLEHYFKDYYDKYEYIRKYAYSPNIEDNYHLYQVEQGFKKYNQELNETNLERINTEYKELWLTSERLGQPISSYFLLTQRVVDIMWEVSLVGVSRGSAASYYTNYLLGIVQINPIEYNLPHWRFLSAERPEMPDIDIDTEAAQRATILERIKDEFGWDNVLSISTVTREKLRSAILTGCRGLGIDNDVAQNIANLIPTDKNGMWTLHECLHGDPEQGKKPVKEVINEFAKYPGLQETVEAIEGVASGRSVHASGVYIFRDGYLSQNALMKTTGGQYVTQFNMDDSDYQGGLKLDFLTINALDRIRSCMELLIEHGKIEWQGSLRATYEKYLHPDVLDMESKEMFDMLYEGEILDAFQFDSVVGSQAIRKIYPTSFAELSASNSLMRLSPDDGESPLDRYVRHKKDLTQWYDEMKENNLTDEEIEVIKKHVEPLYGVADTQEVLMMLAMDEKIANFGLLEANKLRKGVAKVNQTVIDECWEMFKEGCRKQGTSDNMRDYVWNHLFKPQFGYSFSLPHIAGYTTILMQELNLAYRYGVIYWKTACLSVNSGLFGDISGNTNYGAVAKAIGDMSDSVLPPDINKSEVGFTPLEEQGKILFGMKPIAGLGKDALEVVLEKRPYKSFDDFVERAVVGKPDVVEKIDGKNVVTWKDNTITPKKAVILIKAGCFDNLDERDRRQLMIDFTKMMVPPRSKLTMTNLPHIIENVPPRLTNELRVYNFRNKLFGRNAVEMNKELEDFFVKHYAKEVEHTFKNGKLVVDKKSFEKVYKKQIEPLREWVISQEAAMLFNKKKRQEFWIENCMGSVEQWEMETVGFYSKKHELDYAPMERYFDISNFFDLEPDKIVEWRTWGNRRFPRYEINMIAGTVVDKNRDKGIVYLSTQYGVVTVKYYKGSFIHYDKRVVEVRGKDKNVLDESWFKRGTKLVIIGHRRGDEFVPRVYKDSLFKHTTIRIDSFNKTEMKLFTEKAKAS